MKTIVSSSYIIRFSDCDPFGHLNNSRYIDYMLNAREDHLKTNYDLALDNYYRQGLGWVVGGHEIVYMKPARYNEEVVIRTQLRMAGDSELLAELIMLDKEEKQMKAILWSRFVFINLKTGKRENHPEELLAFLRQLAAADHAPDSTLRSRLAAFSSGAPTESPA